MVLSLQAELSYVQSHINSSELTQPPLPPQPQAAVAPAVFSFADLPPPTATTMPVTYDMSTLFDPMGQPSLAMQQQRPNIDPRQYLAAHGPTSTSSHRQIGSSSAPSTNASSSPSSFSKFSK
ncbi:hypothetical protein TSUD_179060 [Trifolium subterraneum]|uniref:LOB domain-containing protein n=1 Tax=Trifolium subterraneum TaxID=3900 RepID=A0A2Z6LH48_TRISU|nr:hypothetical protein TSUD_179060 [Trifolium subterraneum]